MKEKLEQIFKLADKAQELYKSQIMREHSEFMTAFIAAARISKEASGLVEKPFQDKLETASKYRDAYSHMISIIEAKKIILSSKENITNEDIQVLIDNAYEENKLTGMATTINCTNNLLNELTELISEPNKLQPEEQQIATRMQVACGELIDITKQMQKICGKLNPPTQAPLKTSTKSFK